MASAVDETSVMAELIVLRLPAERSGCGQRFARYPSVAWKRCLDVAPVRGHGGPGPYEQVSREFSRPIGSYLGMRGIDKVGEERIILRAQCPEDRQHEP